MKTIIVTNGHNVEITNLSNNDDYSDSLIDDIEIAIEKGENEGMLYDFNSNQFFWEII